MNLRRTPDRIISYSTASSFVVNSNGSISYNVSGTEKLGIDTSGNLQIDGDLTVSGNDIKDSGSNVIFTFDGSGSISSLATISDASLTLSAATCTITHSGATKLILTSTSGTVDIESVNFSGQAVSNISTLSMNNQLTNSLAIGTAPFVITSTTQVANLNVARAGLADTITVADTADTSCYIAMFEDATGNLAIKTDAGLTYNAGTGVLTATGGFVASGYAGVGNSFSSSANILYLETGDAASLICLRPNGTNSNVGLVSFSTTLVTFAAQELKIGGNVIQDSAANDVLKFNGSAGIGLNIGTTAVNEFSTDGTLAGNSDNAVPTEKAVKTYIDPVGMIGSANAAWIPCPFEGSSSPTTMIVTSGIYNIGTSGTDYSLLFRCPLPTNRGGLKLYVTSLKVSIDYADATDYVTDTYFMGSTLTGTPPTIISTHTTDLNAASSSGGWEANSTTTMINGAGAGFTAVDCSAYISMCVYLYCIISTTADQLNITSVAMKCYYAA